MADPMLDELVFRASTAAPVDPVERLRERMLAGGVVKVAGGGGDAGLAPGPAPIPGTPFAGGQAQRAQAFPAGQGVPQESGQKLLPSGSPSTTNAQVSMLPARTILGQGLLQARSLAQMHGLIPKSPHPADSCRWTLDMIARSSDNRGSTDLRTRISCLVAHDSAFRQPPSQIFTCSDGSPFPRSNEAISRAIRSALQQVSKMPNIPWNTGNSALERIYALGMGHAARVLRQAGPDPYIAIHNEALDPLLFHGDASTITFTGVNTGAQVVADIRNPVDRQAAIDWIEVLLCIEILAFLAVLAGVSLPAGSTTSENVINAAKSLLRNPEASGAIKAIGEALLKKDVLLLLWGMGNLLNGGSLVGFVEAAFVGASGWAIAVAVAFFVAGIGALCAAGPAGVAWQLLTLAASIASILGKIYELIRLGAWHDKPHRDDTRRGRGILRGPQGSGGPRPPSDEESWVDYLRRHAAWEERMRRKKGLSSGAPIPPPSPGFDFGDPLDPEPQPLGTSGAEPGARPGPSSSSEMPSDDNGPTPSTPPDVGMKEVEM